MRALLLAAAIALVSGRACAQSDFADWMQQTPERAGEVAAFETYLRGAGVGDVLPAEELLRNATSWRTCRLEWQWSMPPQHSS